LQIQEGGMWEGFKLSALSLLLSALLTAVIFVPLLLLAR